MSSWIILFVFKSFVKTSRLSGSKTKTSKQDNFWFIRWQECNGKKKIYIELKTMKRNYEETNQKCVGENSVAEFYMTVYWMIIVKKVFELWVGVAIEDLIFFPNFLPTIVVREEQPIRKSPSKFFLNKTRF